MSVPAIILAAGASRRLGQPKQLVPVAGETLLGRTIRVVRESGAEPIFVVLGANRQGIQGAVDLGGVELVVNEEWEQGIASSIHAALKALIALLPQADGVMVLVCDQPKLTAEHLRALTEAFDALVEPGMVASAYAGLAGIPAVFPASQFLELLALTGDTGARKLLRNPKGLLITFPFDGGEADIDTPEDLAAIQVSANDFKNGN
jgi:CTP:molybdopterin cytidylyltransferase MocA